MLVMTATIKQYPTQPGSWFGVVPICPCCDFTIQALAANAGNGVPPEGSLLKAERIAGRLVFVYP